MLTTRAMEYLPVELRALVYLHLKRCIRERSAHFARLLIPAVIENNLELLREILVNTGSKNPRALLLAVERNNVPAVKILLDAGFKHTKACELAVERGFTECFKLLTKAGHHLNDDLLLVASRQNNVDIVGFFIENYRGEDPFLYEQALHVALREKKLEVVRLLIEVNTQKTSRIVEQAVIINNVEILSLLLNAGYDVTRDCVDWAIKSKDSACLRILIDSGVQLETDYLLYAVRMSKFNHVEMMFAAGCPVPDNILNVCISRRDVNLVRFFVNKGIPVPENVLDLCISHRDANLVRFFVDRGIPVFRRHKEQVNNLFTSYSVYVNTYDKQQCGEILEILESVKMTEC